MVNRSLAICIGLALALRATGTLRTPAPFYAFSYCSFSNVASSYRAYGNGYFY